MGSMDPNEASEAEYTEPCDICGEPVENAGALVPDGFQYPRCLDCL